MIDCKTVPDARNLSLGIRNAPQPPIRDGLSAALASPLQSAPRPVSLIASNSFERVKTHLHDVMGNIARTASHIHPDKQSVPIHSALFQVEEQTLG